MKKNIIGILSTTVTKDDQDPYSFRYTVCDMFIKKLHNLNAIPIGLIGDDNSIDDNVLNLCDAFLFQGGNIVNLNLYVILEHAIKYNKPVLGICLGMQGIGIYSLVIEEYQKKYSDFDKIKFKEIYTELKELNEGSLLSHEIDKNKHCKGFLTMENKDDFLHPIIIEDNSILNSIYRTNKLDVYSIHTSVLKSIGSSFKVTAKADDGVIEAIEYKDNNRSILGVMFHPELFEDDKIYKWLIDSISK